MSNLARKYQLNEEPKRQYVPQPSKQPTEKKSVITPGEKFLVALGAAIICFFAVQIITTQSSIYDVNKEIQVVQESIQLQEKENRDLEIQVSELSTYERILEKAKELGLNLKEQNVKVVNQ